MLARSAEFHPMHTLHSLRNSRKLSRECHNSASRPDSEHQYPNCVNYNYGHNTLYSLYCIRSWVYINLVPHGCMLFVYKALHPYVTREVLMNVTMNLRTLCRPPALSVRTVTFGGSDGIAATLTPHAIRSRHGGTVAEMTRI